ncbi:large subunit GTPase 1 homolog, partial [Atheta coriaria]|uniref:large subunit GTPase 1 homolog n=1 Tax=Dalotia coriaria TaxID=877792 RepID=UPI0031F42D07
DVNVDELKTAVQQLEDRVEKTADKLTETLEQVQSVVSTLAADTDIPDNKKKSINSNKLLTREELIELFRNFHHGPKVTEGITTIGLVGYPNVGKSSTINALMTVKKVSVSATPGKTKHFQTLFLDKDIMLCDCPGLVMPSFVFTKAEMVINGILPIDQMKDHVPPVNLVSSLIPRHVIEYLYGIMLPLPMEGEDPDRPPTSEELLNAYGYNRGFMTANGQPDNPRSARFILKDYINGKLLYVHAPVGVKQEEFHTFQEQRKVVSERHVQPAREVRASKPNRLTTEDLDKMFFKTQHQGVHAKGERGKATGLPGMLGGAAAGTSMEKPWKKLHKHENKK